MDESAAREQCRHRRLVHAAGGRRFFCRAGDSWLLLGGIQNQRRLAAEISLVRTELLVGTGRVHRRDYLFQFSFAAEFEHSIRGVSVGLRFPRAGCGRFGRMYHYAGKKQDLAAFLSSCLFLVGMLTSATFGVYPYVLPSNVEPTAGLTISNASAAPYGLYIGLAWWIPGMILAGVYSVFVYRHFAGKVSD